MNVDVVVPTRNEQANIVKLIEGVRKASPTYNIIVVDDSDDNRTMMLAVYNGAEFVEGQHKGLGQAIIDGIKACKGDIVVVMDADGSHPASKIPELVEACENGYDMAIGSRYVKGGSVVGWATKRKVISRVAGSIAYPIVGVQNGTSGFFAFRRSIIDGVILQADSWKIMLEVLVKAKPNRVVEIPIEFKDREAGESKFNYKEVINYLKHLVKLALYKWRMLPFMIVGMIGYFVNMAVYYPLTLWFEDTVVFFGQEFYLPPFLVSSYIAITSNYLLNRAFTFKGYRLKKAGYVKYLTTCSASLPVEMVLIFLFVRFMGFIPIMAVAVAILIVFIARYFIVSRYVWHKK